MSWRQQAGTWAGCGSSRQQAPPPAGSRQRSRPPPSRRRKRARAVKASVSAYSRRSSGRMEVTRKRSSEAVSPVTSSNVSSRSEVSPVSERSARGVKETWGPTKCSSRSEGKDSGRAAEVMRSRWGGGGRPPSTSGARAVSSVYSCSWVTCV